VIGKIVELCGRTV